MFPKSPSAIQGLYTPLFNADELRSQARFCLSLAGAKIESSEN